MKALVTPAVDGASFRDPSGFIFERDGTLLRQVNRSYFPTWQAVAKSGLLSELTDRGLLISHRETDLSLALNSDAAAVIQPERVGLISYPFEWSFSALQDAALLTIKLQRRALAKGFSLKDATALNVQFHRGRPVFIDSLSFEAYVEGRPWVAYAQFCRHFLAPLALMSLRDLRLSRLMQEFVDSVPLELASKLLPWRTRFQPMLALHIHLHARAQANQGDAVVKAAAAPSPSLSKKRLLSLLQSLEDAIRGLHSPAKHSSIWRDYYTTNNNYVDDGMRFKEETVHRWLAANPGKMVWDLGANTGRFARLAPVDTLAIAWDFDPVCVDIAYVDNRKEGISHVLPLVLDLTNPTPASGWAHRERKSLRERGPADTLLALGLVHHLAIANNVPLRQVAQYFGEIGKSLIVEFVDRDDSQVKKLLHSREDIFANYSREGFEQAFGEFFEICETLSLPGMARTLYRMKLRLP